MRKHFLILMLLALLPLAGWAAEEDPVEWGTISAYELPNGGYPVNLADEWSIQLSSESVTYTGEDVTPQVRLIKKINETWYYIPSTKFNVSWDAEGPIINVRPNSHYTVTVTCNDTEDGTYGVLQHNTEKFYVLKLNISVETEPVLSDGGSFRDAGYPLLTAGPVFPNTYPAALVNALKVKYCYSSDGGTTKSEWSETIPTVKKVGSYKVYYKIEGTDNYAGRPEKQVGNEDAVVTITGNAFTTEQYTAPSNLDGTLTFTWNATEGKAVEQTLINAGHMNVGAENYGTLWYRFKKDEGDYSEFSTDLPKASDAGVYTVDWKIVASPDYGCIDYSATVGQRVEVTISPKQPTTVTKATGKSNLVYAGDAIGAQALLGTEGSATDGAIVKYQMRYKHTAAAEWPEWGAATAENTVAFADVKATKAGFYQVKTLVLGGGNYLAAEATGTTDVTIAKAQAFTTAPTGKTGLVWNNKNQALVNEAVYEQAHVNKVKYALGANATTAPSTGWYFTEIAQHIVGNTNGTYYVWYALNDEEGNYEEFDPTCITVKIAKKTVSIIANNATKTYDGTGKLNADTDITVDNGMPKFSVTDFVEDFPVSVENLQYTGEDANTASIKDAKDSYVGALTTTVDKVQELNVGEDYANYEYTIIPGNLKVVPRKLYVQAKVKPSKEYGKGKNIANEFEIFVDGDAVAKASSLADTYFSANALPKLKTVETLPDNPEIGKYAIEFTHGTLKTNYTMDLTKGENLDGYVIGTVLEDDQEIPNYFEVKPSTTAQIVITVKPHKQKYTGVAESWDNLKEGTDYVVTGLLGSDKLAVAPTFTREGLAEGQFDVKYDGDNVIGYALTADNAALAPADVEKYPGGIVYNNSTFTIEPVELTATVEQQTIYKDMTEEEANAALDQTAWDVEGRVNGESLEDLAGSLAINVYDETDAPQGAKLGEAYLYAKGIVLTINNGNYTLKANTEFGALRVITTNTFEMDPTDAELAQKIDAAAEYCAAATNHDYDVTFAHKALKANTWYTMVLPFDVKTTELVANLKAKDEVEVGQQQTYHEVYAIVNTLSANSTANHISYTIEMNKITANVPFLIKVAEDVNMQDVTFTDRKIKAGTTTVGNGENYGGNKFVGVYTATSIKSDGTNVYGFLGDPDLYEGMENQWYEPANNAWNVKPLEAYLIYSPNKTVAAPLITVEDFGGQTTAISEVKAGEFQEVKTDGWYTINGIKLQGAPTEKGIYINNGKKIVVK